MSTPRVRIAPSPTGNLHVGTARAGLFNYLFAKKHGGVFVLRIEDTDLERSEKKYEKDIFDGLRWLGINPDEGPEQGGPYAPYRQTERTHTYKKYLEKLLSEGKAFYCFHSQRELEEEKEELLKAKRPPLHMCEYRSMDPRDATMLTETKSDYIIRFKTPGARKITFHDLIRGDVSFNSDLLGDFSIAKKIDVPLYHFAVVVDDEGMRISHVIRGEDHIANTPKHILLMEALGFAMPQFAHLPLLLGSDRSKLSKRHGATSIAEYRESGYLPEAMFNFLALLGWNPGGDQEIFSKEELTNLFSLEHVQKSGAIFDTKKLDWMNREYIKKEGAERLAKEFAPQFYARNSVSSVLAVQLEQPRLTRLSEIGELLTNYWNPPEYDKNMLRWRNMTDEEILTSLDKSIYIITGLEQLPETEIDDTGKIAIRKEHIEKAFMATIGDGDKGILLWPLRVALIGRKASPGPFEIMEILGVEESLKRIRVAQEKLRRHV